MTSRGLYLAGGWTDALSGERLDVTDPGTGEIVGSTAAAGAADVDRAVDAALAAQRLWADTPAGERAAILHAAADRIEARIEEIARLLTLEQGKPLPDSRKEIGFAIEVFHYYAEEGKRVPGALRPTQRRDIRSIVQWAPVGVVGAVVPWNYPVDLYAWKVGPALAAGDAIIVKPPLESPLAIGVVVECFHDAGLPAGLLSDLPGGLEAGERISSHPRIAMVTATASTATGQAIMRSAAGTMKRLSLELGGQSPFIVLDDADVPAAAAAAARRSFSNAGQICIAVNRILVADPIADEFVAAVSAEAERIRIGHGLDPATTGGPATTEAVLGKAERHIADAVDRGAVVTTGGHRLRDGDLARGHYFAPAVVDRVPLDALAMTEETFGPVVAVHRYAADLDVDGLADLANDNAAGLAAYVFGGDLDRAWGLAERLEVGGVGVNINDITELQAPFGGWKMSGFGRELGPEGLTAFMQQRHIRMLRRY
ncbi:NAD-dependent succinate-semialdehyde dehydrogenase [Cnuibacter physcomitrellae]|uniref:NAD-dependent succinate-semialdehyde dehydrogenase n=1 Tax=Cnuibacter physcomitrellae TaxID=1619308 RepID=A0A1X9LJF9_9MICO|nr:aldehyde dehydrogenase family protein [Cnuibacter physcomitrellae]ARJ04438.1 NAD-dependent succinate-semialdehyde dehydrogenase [Cnuibacter physcomitrellae]GGI41054.1 NAD-dependent succinate-semialdehyde dehydrogenase [Cnuibacter physcomitrellae]